MRVFLIPSSDECVGVAVHVLDLASLLHKYGVAVCVLCPGCGWLFRELSKRGVAVEAIPLTHRPTRFFSCSWLLWNRIRKMERHTIIHFHGRLPMIVGLGSILSLRGKIYVATKHEHFASSRGGMRWLKEFAHRISYRLIDRIWCVSNSVANDLRANVASIHHGRVEVIYNWYDSNGQAERALGIQGEVSRAPCRQSTLKVCAIGRLVEDKGFDLLIRALAVLKAEGLRLSCDIWGGGEELENLQRLCATLDVADVVVLRGARDSARDVIHNYDVMVVPSRREAFGLVVLEAYAAGVPVVVSDIPGLEEVVANDCSGLVVDPADVNALSDAIMKIARDPKVRTSLVSGGKALLETMFSKNKKGGEIVQFYNSALNYGRRRRFGPSAKVAERAE